MLDSSARCEDGLIDLEEDCEDCTSGNKDCQALFQCNLVDTACSGGTIVGNIRGIESADLCLAECQVG